MLKDLSNLLPQYQVEGFNPNAALTKVVDTTQDGETQEALFMKFQPALCWFLTVFPDGCLNHQFVVLNDKKATVTANIYRNAVDTRPAATATCTRYYGEDTNGKYYEQNAVTAAYRKALGYLGFGTPLDAEEVEGIPVEMGNAIPERTDPGVILAPRPPVPQGLDNFSSKAAKNIDNVPAPATVATPPEEKAPPQEESPKPVATEPKAEVAKMPTTYEEAKSFVMPFGKSKGMTIEETAKVEGNSYISWFANRIKNQDPDSPLAKALQLYCSMNGI